MTTTNGSTIVLPDLDSDAEVTTHHGKRRRRLPALTFPQWCIVGVLAIGGLSIVAAVVEVVWWLA